MSEPTPSVIRDQVFISYSHQDSEWLARLRIALKPLERQGKLNLVDIDINSKSNHLHLAGCEVG